MRNIGIVGAGAMGSAIFQGLSDHSSEITLHIFDRHPEKTSKLSPSDNYSNIEEFLTGLDTVILAIKPQSFSSWDLKLPNQLVLSVLAGISLKTLQEKTGTQRVARLMPNLPVREQAGYTAWIAGDTVSEDDRKLIKLLLTTLGKELELTDEDQMHAISITAGSGPAYFFHLAHCLAQEAEKFGFSPQESLDLAKQALIGAAKLLENSSDTPEEWRNRVTSKAGLTEAALKQFHEKGFDNIIGEAVRAGEQRSRELDFHGK